MALPWPITWTFSDSTKPKSWTQNSMYGVSAGTQPCLELVNKQTKNEKYWNAQVALYKRASWYSPVSNLLTRGTTAPTLLSTILPLYVHKKCVRRCTNICKFLLKNMIIQTNYNIGRLISYQKFYRKVIMPLSFFFKTPLPCFASYSLTNFCLLALKDDIQSPREEQECERDCAGLCPTPQFLFCHRVPARPFCATTGGPSPSRGAKFTRGIPTDHSDSQSDKARHKKYSWLRIIFLSNRSSRGWILADIDPHPTINWWICKDHGVFFFKSPIGMVEV